MSENRGKVCPLLAFPMMPYFREHNSILMENVPMSYTYAVWQHNSKLSPTWLLSLISVCTRWAEWHYSESAVAWFPSIVNMLTGRSEYRLRFRRVRWCQLCNHWVCSLSTHFHGLIVWLRVVNFKITINNTPVRPGFNLYWVKEWTIHALIGIFFFFVEFKKFQSKTKMVAKMFLVNVLNSVNFAVCKSGWPRLA